MLQPGDELCFAGQRGIQDFQSHRPVELAVVRSVNHTQSAAADLGFYFVTRISEVGQRGNGAQMIED